MVIGGVEKVSRLIGGSPELAQPFECGVLWMLVGGFAQVAEEVLFGVGIFGAGDVK
jgi:hypothetical protein